MNEMELSPELVAREIANEAVAEGILTKTKDGLMWLGDAHDWIITITARRKTDSKNAKRLREEDDRGYN